MKRIVWKTIGMLIFVCHISMNANSQSKEQEITLNNHFDVIEQFSSIKSKSRQIILMAKKSMGFSPALDSIRFRYMNLKGASDGAISRYKSMIENPAAAKKAGASIENSIKQVVNEMNGLTKFYLENNRTPMGFKQIPGLGFIQSFGGLGTNLYSEIRNIQKSKRDEMKQEIDTYILPEFDEIQVPMQGM
jgi:hypothetical protein